VIASPASSPPELLRPNLPPYGLSNDLPGASVPQRVIENLRKESLRSGESLVRCPPAIPTFRSLVPARYIEGYHAGCGLFPPTPFEAPVGQEVSSPFFVNSGRGDGIDCVYRCVLGDPGTSLGDLIVYRRFFGATKTQRSRDRRFSYVQSCVFIRPERSPQRFPSHVHP